MKGGGIYFCTLATKIVNKKLREYIHPNHFPNKSANGNCLVQKLNVSNKRVPISSLKYTIHYANHRVCAHIRVCMWV